jgi:hypothetical protein
MLSTAQQPRSRVVRIVACAIKENPDPQRNAYFLRLARGLFPVFLILGPMLGVQVDGFGLFVAVVFRRVWNVATQSLIPCSDP